MLRVFVLGLGVAALMAGAAAADGALKPGAGTFRPSQGTFGAPLPTPPAFGAPSPTPSFGSPAPRASAPRTAAPEPFRPFRGQSTYDSGASGYPQAPKPKGYASPYDDTPKAPDTGFKAYEPPKPFEGYKKPKTGF